EVMRHPGTVGGRRLGRADVETAIDLHGIHGTNFPAELLCERERDFGFSNGSRPGDEDGTKMEDGRWKMGFRFVGHHQSSILHPRFCSRRESTIASARPATKIGTLIHCAGVRPK